MTSATKKKLQNQFLGILRDAVECAKVQLGTDSSPQNDLILACATPHIRDLATKVVMEEPYSARFSASFLTARIEQRILDQFDSSNIPSAVKIFTELVAELDTFAERKIGVHLLEGITLNEPFAIGPFTLRPFNETTIEHLKQIVATAGVGDNLLNMFLEQRSGGIIAEVEIIADAKKAAELSLEWTSYLADLLQFAAASSYHHSRLRLRRGTFVICLKGAYSTEVQRDLVLPMSKGDTSYRIWRTGSLGTFDDQSVRSIFQENCLISLAGCLSRQRTKLENKLLLAVHWFAESQRQSNSARELLCLVIGLECLFAGRGAKYRIANAAALVVGTTLSQRKRIFELVTHIYEQRSKIVHEGETTTDDAQIQELKSVFIDAVQRFIGFLPQWKEPAAFERWIHEQNLSYFPGD